MSASLVLSWREGVQAEAGGDGVLVVRGADARISFQDVPPVLADAVHRFSPPGEDEQDLAELVRAGNGSLARWYYYLTRLSQRGMLCQSARVNDTPLATLVPVSASFEAPWTRPVAGRRYVLSRFAYLHRVEGEAVLESPLSHARIIVNDCRAAALVGALALPATAQELARRFDSGEGSVALVLTLLYRAGMLSEADDEGTIAEDSRPALQTCEFHDLLFHFRSRRGRFDAPHGATYRFVGRLAPPPALKPIPAGEAQELERPDLARLEREDAPLTHVLERRRSVRDYDAECPLTRRQLGEFLFRVGRVKDHWEDEVETVNGAIRMDFASRPYPAGGSLYELELYLAVNVCDRLEPGLYDYDPSQHRLIRLCGRTPAVASLLRDAAESTGIAEHGLQVLLILAARLPRIAWKYESIAYALTLKHVGVVMQNMYLVATAMGLAPCAVGGGDSDLFARAAGIDSCTETSVGEFLLASRRRDDDDCPLDGLFLAGDPGEPARGGQGGRDHGIHMMKE